MIQIEIGKNEQGQRLDKFLRKYLPGAPLSRVYRALRKDVKVNGKRKGGEYVLEEGDTLSLYLSDAELSDFRKQKEHHRVRRTFQLCYEDDDILIAGKPAGLLTHGDGREKRNHLTNQVIDYLIETGGYDPRAEKTFVPAPVNRLDRNTSGLVIFCKNYPALQCFNELIRENRGIRKYYLTILTGRLDHELMLRGRMEKDEAHNRTRVVREDGEGRMMLTRIRPLLTKHCGPYDWTLAEVEITTGRTHQIRAQAQAAGYPVIGDSKYGDPAEVRFVSETFGLTTQLLHAYRLVFEDMPPDYQRLEGKTVIMKVPARFRKIAGELFGPDGFRAAERGLYGKSDE